MLIPPHLDIAADQISRTALIAAVCTVVVVGVLVTVVVVGLGALYVYRKMEMAAHQGALQGAHQGALQMELFAYSG